MTLVILLIYLAGMYVYFGIPCSLSDTHYLLEEKRKGLGRLFTAVCTVGPVADRALL